MTTTTQEDEMTTMTATEPADVPRDSIDPIAVARARVAGFLQVELDWSARLDELGTSQATLEASAGDEVLDGADLAELAHRIGTARLELDIVDRAIAAARARRVTAIGTVFQHEAGALFAQAAAKRAEAATRREATDPLLEQLAQREGVTYAPVEPDRPAVLAEGRGGGTVDVVTRKVTMTEWLLLEAEDLELRARAERSVTQHGMLEAGSLEELVAGATEDPMHIGPTIASIRRWATDGAARITADIARGEARRGPVEARAWGEGRPVRYQMYWGRGEIDAASSRVFAEPQEPIEETSRGGLRRTFDRTSR